MDLKFGGLTRSPCGIQGFQLGLPVARGGSSDIIMARRGIYSYFSAFQQMGDQGSSFTNQFWARLVGAILLAFVRTSCL